MEKKTIQDWLKGVDAEFDKTDDKAIKIVRHADGRTNGTNKHSKKLLVRGKPFPANITSIYALYVYKKDLFLAYQSEQKKGCFNGVKYIVSFIGERGTTARFVGVYEILGRHQSPYSKDEEILNLKPVESFVPLEEKLIVEWGKNANAWHQYYYNAKPVIGVEESIPSTTGIPVFKSYLDTMLSYSELQMVVNNPDWIEKLKAVQCIYAILDDKTGKLYVGSTYSAKGMYGRWFDYAYTGHGYDKKLAELVSKNSNYAKDNFKWCILEVLPLNVTRHDAIEQGNIWKEKLGTREHGNNIN